MVLEQDLYRKTKNSLPKSHTFNRQTKKQTKKPSKWIVDFNLNYKTMKMFWKRTKIWGYRIR